MDADNQTDASGHFALPPALTKAEKEALVASIRAWNKDPEHKEYLERGRVAAEEYRRKVDEEARRLLEEEGK